MGFSLELLKEIHPDKKISVSKIADSITKFRIKHFNNINKIQVNSEDNKKVDFLVNLDFDEIIYLHDLIWCFGLLLDDQFIADFFDAVSEK